MTHNELRQAYITFFQERGHVSIEPASLVLQNDATTLFTSSGMQPLVPYLAGTQRHASGNRLVDVQPCIRTQDIDDVGDNRHTTFFEMLGNWSLGDYFKKEQITWKWEFLTKIVGLAPEKLYVTVFEGDDLVQRDEESAQIWRDLGIADDHIYYYGVKSNWWSRSGTPEKMPTGEIGGPDSEIFYDFGNGPHTGPDSDEKRFLEIGNSVFMQYMKNADGSLSMLPQKNVDFGGGLERILAAQQGNPDIFLTDLFTPVMKTLEEVTHTKYADHSYDLRIIVDHMRASLFLIHDGVQPSNKEHGYILRRLLRRAGMRMHALTGGVEGLSLLKMCVKPLIQTYDGIYFDATENAVIEACIDAEMKRFSATFEKGLAMIRKQSTINGKTAFDLFQSYGFPVELTAEIAESQGMSLDMHEYEAEKEKHRQLSQTSSAGKFKGGLADASDQVVRFHTATHLLHQALRDVCGASIRQEGSNITQERLRFDVFCDHVISPEDVQTVEKIMNEKIKEDLPVYQRTMDRQHADQLGAQSFFKEKDGDTVSVYAIGGTEDDMTGAYSLEFCGGPHVMRTGEIGPIAIQKFQKIGAQLTRFYVISAS